MTDSDNPQADTSSPKTRRWRPRTPMDQDDARRQGAIAALAFVQFGDRDSAVEFLNTHNDTLGARPLDVASESDEGFEEVTGLIASHAG